MEDILKEITDKQKEITLLYTKLRRAMRLYEHDTKLLSIQKINRATEDLKHVCKTLDVTTDRVCSRERSLDVLVVRQSLAYIFNEKYGMTLASIGLMFNRDHSTIINSINRVKDAIWLYEHKGIDNGLIIKSLNSICEIVGVKQIQLKK
jgi:chromosomal replication initiation ATPase DnaA